MPLPSKFYVQPEKLSELAMLKKALEFEAAKAKREGKSVQTIADELKNNKKLSAIAGITAGIPSVANSADYMPGRKRKLGSYNNSVFDKLEKEYNANDFGAVGASAFEGALTELEDLWQLSRQINDGVGNPLSLLTGNAPEETARFGNQEVRQQYRDEMPTINNAGSYLPDVVGGIGAVPAKRVGKGAGKWLLDGQGQYLDDIINKAQLQQAYIVPPGKKVEAIKQPFEQAEMGWQKPRRDYSVPEATVKETPNWYREPTLTPEQYISDSMARQATTSPEDLAIIASRRRPNPNDIPLTNKDTINKIAEEIRNTGRGTPGIKPVSKIPQGEGLASSAQRNEVFNRVQEPLQQDTLLARQVGYMKNNQLPNENTFGSNFVLDENNIKGIEDLLYNEFSKGRGVPMISRAPKGTNVVNKRDTGIGNELLMQEGVNRALKDRMPLDEWLRLTMNGQRPFAVGGGVAGGIGLMDLLQSTGTGNEEL